MKWIYQSHKIVLRPTGWKAMVYYYHYGEWYGAWTPYSRKAQYIEPRLRKTLVSTTIKILDAHLPIHIWRHQRWTNKSHLFLFLVRILIFLHFITGVYLSKLVDSFISFIEYRDVVSWPEEKRPQKKNVRIWAKSLQNGLKINKRASNTDASRNTWCMFTSIKYVTIPRMQSST